MKLRVLFLMLLLCGSHVPEGLIYAEPKNSNVEDIGNRDINKGSWNFTSLEKGSLWADIFNASPNRRSH